MASDKRKALYDQLVNDNYDLGTFEDFNKSLDNETNRKNLYETITADNYDVGSYEDFESNTRRIDSEPYEETVSRMRERLTEAPLSDVASGLQQQREKERQAIALHSFEGQRLAATPHAYPGIRKEHEDEERYLDGYYTPREVKSPDDVYQNYRDRFALTERGEQLQNEYDDILRQTQGKYMSDFQNTPEYREISSRPRRTQEEADAANQALTEAFNKKYGEALAADMQPYEEAMQHELQTRYGGKMQDELRELSRREIRPQIDQLQAEVDSLKEEASGLGRDVVRMADKAISTAIPVHMPFHKNIPVWRDATLLDAADKMLQEARNITDEAGRTDKNSLAAVGRGIVDNTHADDYQLFNWTPAIDEKLLGEVLEKSEKGETLSPAEQKLLDASVINMATQAYFSSDLGRAYKAGQTTAASLPFMLQFIANPISGSGKAIAKSLLNYGLKRFGTAAASRIAGRGATGAASRFAARFLGDTAAAAGMTLTTGLPGVAENTLQRLNSNYEYGFDDLGQLQVRKTGDTGIDEAVGKSLASSVLENQSEMIFNAFRGWGRFLKAADKAAPSGAGSFMSRLSSTRMGRLYKELKDNPTLREAMSRAQFHGLPEEYLEEVYNNLANVPLGDMTLEEVADLDQNIDTFLGLLPTQAAFSMLGLGSMATERYTNRRRIDRLRRTMDEEQQRKFDELQRLSKERGNEDIREFIKQTMADNNLTPEQKRDEIEYAFAIATGNAMDEVQEVETQEAIDRENQDIESHTDPQTRWYTEMDRIVYENGQEIRVPGYKTGEMGGLPLWVPEGADISPENTIALKPGEWDEASVQSMPADEVKAASEEMIREQAAAQAEREAAYSPAITPYKELALGSTFQDKDGNRYEVAAADVDSGDWIMEKWSPDGKPLTSEPMTEQKYLDTMQEAIDAQSAGQSPTSGGAMSDIGQGNVGLSSGEAGTQVSEIQTPVGTNLSDEADENGYHFVKSANGTSIFGEVRKDSGLTPAPIKLSEGYQDENGKGYGLAHIEANYGRQIRNAGFVSVEDFVSYVAMNYDEDNIRVGKRRINGSPTYLIQVTDTHDNTLFVELSKDGSYWNVNSAGIFRKGYSNKKETVAKTEPQQPNNAISIGSSLSENEVDGITFSDPNGKPTVSENKSNVLPAENQAFAEESIPTDEKGNLLYHRVPVDMTVSSLNQEGLEPEEIDAFVKANKDASAKLLKTVEGKAPKMGTNISQYKAAKQAWQERLADAQAQADYWDEVGKVIAAQRVQPGDATAEEIRSMGEPMDGHELAAMMLATGRLPLLQSDFKRETGYQGGEVRNLFGLFASKENGGMTIEQAGEQLMLADLEGGTNFFDQSDPNAGRNAILDVLAEPRTRGDLTNYIRRNRERQAAQESRAEYEAYEAWCEREMHMTPEEYETYQAYVLENNPYEGVPVAELERIFAEAEEEYQNYLASQEYGQGASESRDGTNNGPSQRNEPAGEAGGRKTGVPVLPEAQPVLQGQTEGRTGGTETEPGTADDGVRAAEGIISEGASGSEGIENRTNEGDNQINVVSSQRNQTKEDNGTVSEPVPQGEHRTETPQDSRMEEAADRLRQGSRTHESLDGRSGEALSLQEKLNAEAREAESYAKETGQWIPMSRVFDLGMPGPSGNEADTYVGNDGYIYKVNNLMNSKGILSLLERYQLHNQIFPESKYELVGFTGFDGGNIYPVFRQQYVAGASLSTPEEIDTYMQSLGFHQMGEAEYSNGDITISDLRPRNVLKDADGDLYVVDADFRRNEQTDYATPELQENENLLDYAERVAKTKEIDDARKEVAPSPTDAQKEAGNYKKGHITLDGYDITIENPKGSTRSGVDANGQPWSVTMNNDYGYIRGTQGVDGDHIDVFLSDDPTTGKVYVVDQVKEDGSFDEHKVMYGFKSALAAKRAYLANYSPGWKGLGTINEVSKEEFKKWVNSSHRKTKPFAKYKSVKAEGVQNESTKPWQPHALPGRLMKAYESGDETLIASVEQEMRDFVNGADDMRRVYTTYLRSKDLERAMEKDSPSNKTQHFIAEACKDALKKAGLPAKAMQSERARMEVAGSTTDARVLDVMSADTSYDVANAIIRNPHTSNETLERFVKTYSNNGPNFDAQQELDKRKAAQNGQMASKHLPDNKKMNREQEEVEKVKQKSGPVEKIEDVGEKIGGAKKDRFKEFVEKEKQIQEKPDSFMEELRKLPVSKIFNFNLEALRKDGLSNEAATLIDVIRRVIPSKPRTDWKLKRWVSDVFGLYRFCLTLATAEQGTFENILERATNIKQIGGMYRAQMALGGFDSGLDTGQATLEELDDSAGHYDKDGSWVSIKGQWYVTHAGRYGGIYPDYEKAIEALTKFAGENSQPKGKGTEVKFSVYSYKHSGESFITPKGKPDIVVESGFKNSKEALAYLNEHMDELQAKYRNMKETTSIGFAPNGERRGKDWRGGKDVTAEDFRSTFGFRGVEFGNWANQQERQLALNQAYDAFMDLSEATGISPRGLSLGGELGMAFGARGGGNAAAHYEAGRVVINLTKTQGAGTLAHEWWHAIDNYFSRRRGQALGYNTERKGYKLPVRGSKVERENEAERKEITNAFYSLMRAINGSSYGKRSNAYASLKSSYWKEPTELGARAFAVWVERKLSEKGVVNNFLANNNVIGWESPELTQKYYPYPLESDFESLDTAFDGLFGAIEEKVDEETGNTVLYRMDDYTTNEEEANDLFRVVDDASEIERLNNEPTIKVYRAMSLVDGKLYPPMSKKIGTGNNRISQAPSEFGQWEVSDERPELVEKEGKNKKHIYIVKDNGKGLWVAYNPYFYTSRNPLNDQFAEAYQRPNLVTVEVEVPESELTSGYQAEGAKDPVGETRWNAGPVNRQLSGDKKRKVILSRWMRPVRIVPESEVAQRIAELIDGENVAIPDNTVTPSLLEELKKLGVKIVDGINKKRKKATTALRSGNGALTDDDLSIANDPVSKLLGKSTRTARQRREFAERERRNMVSRVQELAEKLHLDNVEIVTDASTLQGRRAKAKGFFNPATGKITIVIPNQTSAFDAEQTLLHEAVVHYGLRQLFGEHFDTFLANVFANADREVRDRIVELSRKHGWNTEVATEEYLASLAEETNFENINASWWGRIKELFLHMLHQIGFEGFDGVTLSDNELRYILWRSYENLREPGRYRSILGKAEDIAKQYELKVGNYAPNTSSIGQVAEAANSVKAERIRKLRESKPVEITGEEIEPSDDLKQYKKNALEYGKKLQGSYTNKDTGITIQLQRGRRNGGINEVLQHDYKDVEHLQSIAAIPQIIENSIYIDSHENIDADKNPDVKEYQYYVCGLKIGGVDYTVRSTVAMDKNGNRYYDHKLTHIEKGKLLDLINGQAAYDNGFGTTPGTKPTTEMFSDYKDKVLLSILQPSGEENLLFRETPDGNTADDGTREAYNRAVSGTRFKAQEAYQDSMLALKRLQETVEQETGKLKGYENAYLAENQMSSKSTRETEVYGQKYFKPMLEAVGKLMEQGATYQEVIDYMVAKHGLERNEVFAERDARQEADSHYEKQYKELEQLYKLGGITEEEYSKRKEKLDSEKENYYQERLEQHKSEDYSGLTALMDRHGQVENLAGVSPQLDPVESRTSQNPPSPDDFARQLVADFEKRHDTRDLWDKVNAATEETLRKSYESGMMSRDMYNKVKEQFKYYIPLRGWDEQTAEDVYEYMNAETSPVNAVLKTAKGRRSLADDPLATIGNMAESAILQGNRNLMKQAFLNMAINHPTDLLTVKRAWYVKDPSTGEWTVSFPDIQEGDDADAISSKVEEHERRMKELKDNGEATQSKEGLDIDYRIGKRQAQEHIVPVKRNGRDYLVYVNGNPRTAQAVNGLTNPTVESNKLLAGISRFNRELAANFTNRNPAFVLSNLTRDLIFSVSAVAVKENTKYAARFARNIPRAMSVIARNLRGKGNSENADDRLFEEFLSNGGETGYTSLHSVDDYKKLVKRSVGKYAGKRDYFAAARAAAGFFSAMNRWAEDVSRFTTYMTSREEGRDIATSVNDAKEVTVNFNRRGAAAKTSGFFGWTAGTFRNLYLFFNAAVQSLANFSRLAKKNRKAFLVMLGGFTTAGFLVPYLNAVMMSLTGDGDDDYYANLPEWVRRNNLCIYVPGSKGKFITIPLPIELRAFYGLGEMAWSESIGGSNNPGGQIAYQAINQMTELLPINPLGNNGDLVTTLMPDAIAPFWDIINNKDFTGKPIYRDTPFNEDYPEWTKAYKGTADWLVNLSEWTNELAGGDKYKVATHAEPVANWNPAKVEHLFESYFGGLATTINQAAKTLAGGVESVIDGKWSDDLQWYSTPVLNRFLNDAADDRTAYRDINNRYYRMYDTYKEVERLSRGYSQEVARGNLDYLEPLVELYQSDDYRLYKWFEANKPMTDRIRDLEKWLPDSAEKERETLGRETARLKKAVVQGAE